jgi:hypothetical protein
MLLHAVRLTGLMRTARYFVVALCAFSIAGCGGDDEIDTDKAESEIAKGVEESTATDDVKVDCPDVEKEEGAVFECSLTAEGGVKATVKVTQVDDEGKIRWEVNP